MSPSSLFSRGYTIRQIARHLKLREAEVRHQLKKAGFTLKPGVPGSGRKAKGAPLTQKPRPTDAEREGVFLSLDDSDDSPLPDIPRPRTRGECAGIPRPCPFVSCRYHLYLQVDKEGRISLNQPRVEVGDLPISCSLDVADKGGGTLDEVGLAFGVSRERIRQIETKALPKLQRAVRRAGLDLRELLTPEPSPHWGRGGLSFGELVMGEAAPRQPVAVVAPPSPPAAPRPVEAPSAPEGPEALPSSHCPPVVEAPDELPPPLPLPPAPSADGTGAAGRLGGDLAPVAHDGPAGAALPGTEDAPGAARLPRQPLPGARRPAPEHAPDGAPVPRPDGVPPGGAGEPRAAAAPAGEPRVAGARPGRAPVLTASSLPSPAPAPEVTESAAPLPKRPRAVSKRKATRKTSEIIPTGTVSPSLLSRVRLHCEAEALLAVYRSLRTLTPKENR
jgi:hypothetical protein